MQVPSMALFQLYHIFSFRLEIPFDIPENILSSEAIFNVTHIGAVMLDRVHAEV
jgi:hypothetical protein